ncbi:MAG: hypothetical protein NTW21_06015 [Verrucomicrobia bacterium]|nr:hypothetical protein [Verrucomicrobiota bacterium]
MNLLPAAGNPATYSEWRLGDNGNQGSMVVMRNGAVNFSAHSYLLVGIANGYSAFNQLGGTVTCPKDNATTSFNASPGALSLQYRMNRADCFGIYNLNGGTLTTGAIFSGDGTSGLSQNNAYLNFHGGTLSPAANEANFVRTTITGTQAALAAPQLIAYSEGAVIDTASFDITIKPPLKSPSGSGVPSGDYPLAEADQGSGYRATPLVLVVRDGTDTSGVCATAIANMVDDGTGNGTFRIASINIVNPGLNNTAL